MSNRNQNNIDPKTAGVLKTIFIWVAILVCLRVFWPAGIFLIYKQLSKPSVKNSRIYNAVRDGWGEAKEEFRENVEAQKSTKGNIKSSKKKQECNKRIPKASGVTVLLILAVILFIAGLSNIVEGIDYSEVYQLCMGVFYAIGGGVALCARGMINRRVRRLTKYITVMGFDDAKSVDELSEITGISKKKVRKDLNYLAERGYFGDTAYFDIGLDSIVISPEAAENERRIRYAAEKADQSEKESSDDKYYSILVNMRRLGESIKDQTIAQKVERLIELTGKIFKLVDENPEKEPQIKKFTEYYLPATGKLLRSYSMLEKQGISGKNIESAKQDIERVLDSLIDGYERQLDKLFDTDALDISSDVDVLEAMLKKDGLTGGDFSDEDEGQMQIPLN